MTSLTLPYPPSVNNLYATIRGRRVLSAEGRTYKQTVAALAYQQGCKPIGEGEVSVVLNVHRPRRAGDLDNSLKAILDGLKGIAWTDDAQVGEIHVKRFEDKADPHVEVWIHRRTA